MISHRLFLAFLLALAACSSSSNDDDNNGGDNDGDNDTSDDDTTDDDGGGSGVTVTVTKEGAPAASVRIILHDASGAVTGELTTNASGVATAASAPAQLTVVPPSGASVDYITYTNVADGDSLTVDIPKTTNAQVASWSMTLGPWDGAGTASSYVTYPWFCGTNQASALNTTNPFVMGLGEKCSANNNAVIAIAYNGSTVLGYRYAKDLSLPPASTTASIGPETGWFEDATFTIKLTGAPGDVDLATSSVDFLVGGHFYGLPDSSGDVRGPGGDQYPYPPGFATSYLAEVVAEGGDWSVELATRDTLIGAGGSDRLVTFQWIDKPARVTSTTAGVTVAKRPEASWTFESGASGDGFLVRLSAAGTQWLFVISGPTATHVQAPQMPADLQALLPNAGVSVNLSGALYSASVIATPRAFREMRVNAYGIFEKNEVFLPIDNSSVSVSRF